MYKLLSKPPGSSFDAMKMKPECSINNRHLSLLSNFANQQFNPCKTFDCITQSCCDFISTNMPNLNSNFSKNYSNVIKEPIHEGKPSHSEKLHNDDQLKMTESKNKDQMPKKQGRARTRNEKGKQKGKKHKKHRKREPKHTKQQKNRPWHKMSLEMEINEGAYPSDDLESPIISQLCASVNAASVTNNTNSPVLTDAVDGCYSPPKHNFRPCFVSECESEDSFIVFENKRSSSDSESSSDEDSSSSNFVQYNTCTSPNNKISYFGMCLSIPTKSSVPSDTVDGCYSPKQCQFRPRLASDCGSEDSFVVFDDGFRNVCDESILFESSDEDSDDASSYTTDQSNDTCGASPRKKINIKCGHPYLGKILLNQKKKMEVVEAMLTRWNVRFASQENLCEVHPMIQWSFAYQKARKGPWEQFALDRMRFQNRITNTQSVLDRILEPSHRSKIYKERFGVGV